MPRAIDLMEKQQHMQLHCERRPSIEYSTRAGSLPFPDVSEASGNFELHQEVQTAPSPSIEIMNKEHALTSWQEDYLR